MHQALRVSMAAGGALALAVAGAACTSAGATLDTKARGGAETFVLTTTSAAANPAYSMTASGVFAAHGQVTGVGAQGNTSIVRLADGSFYISHPVKDEKVTARKVNYVTCAIVLRQTGNFTLSRGTGAYAGISGYGTDKGTYTATLPRRKDGTCNTGPAASPVAGSVHAVMTAPATILIPPQKSS